MGLKICTIVVYVALLRLSLSFRITCSFIELCSTQSVYFKDGLQKQILLILTYEDKQSKSKNFLFFPFWELEIGKLRIKLLLSSEAGRYNKKRFQEMQFHQVHSKWSMIGRGRLVDSPLHGTATLDVAYHLSSDVEEDLEQ